MKLIFRPDIYQNCQALLASMMYSPENGRSRCFRYVNHENPVPDCLYIDKMFYGEPESYTYSVLQQPDKQVEEVYHVVINRSDNGWIISTKPSIIPGVLHYYEFIQRIWNCTIPRHMIYCIYNNTCYAQEIEVVNNRPYASKLIRKVAKYYCYCYDVWQTTSLLINRDVTTIILTFIDLSC